MSGEIAVRDYGEVPLCTLAPFDSRSRGKEAAIARDKLAAKADEGGVLRLEKPRDATEACPASASASERSYQVASEK